METKNPYKFIVPSFGAAYPAPNEGISDKIFNTNRGVEIVKISTCPGASKKPKCTCP